MLKKILFVMMLLPALSFADTPRGEKLVQQLWKDIQAKRIEKIKEYTSKEFQAIIGELGPTEVFNRYEELTNIENQNIQSFSLSDIRATQGENIIVVTYNLTAVITDESPITTHSTLISVWKRFDDEWKWVAQGEILQGGAIPAPPS